MSESPSNSIHPSSVTDSASAAYSVPWIAASLRASPGELLQRLTGEQMEGVTEISSGVEGPHIYLSGSLHGNEPVGAQVLYALHLAQEHQPLLTRGQSKHLIVEAEGARIAEHGRPFKAQDVGGPHGPSGERQNNSARPQRDGLR